LTKITPCNAIYYPGRIHSLDNQRRPWPKQYSCPKAQQNPQGTDIEQYVPFIMAYYQHNLILLSDATVYEGTRGGYKHDWMSTLFGYIKA